MRWYRRMEKSARSASERQNWWRNRSVNGAENPLGARKEYCGVCDRKKHFFDSGKAVFVYQGAVQHSLYRFKYANRREYAAFYGKMACIQYARWISRLGIDAIIPVPLHRKRGGREGIIGRTLCKGNRKTYRNSGRNEIAISVYKYQDPRRNLMTRNARKIWKRLLQSHKI